MKSYFKNLIPFFRGSYPLPVDFKNETSANKCFLVLGKNQLTFCRNICGKKQQFPLCQFDELPGIICTFIDMRRWNYETLN